MNLSDIDILAITKPENLFSSPDAVKDEYRMLSLAWHPDKNASVNSDVFPHIHSLYKTALRKIEGGYWGFLGSIIETTISGNKYRFNYKSKHILEIGEMYVGNTIVAFKIPKDCKDLVDNAASKCSSIKYASPKMEDAFKPCMPSHKFTDETDTHMLVVYKKDESMLCLQDVLTKFDNAIDPNHVAWIMSRLYNINCFLSYNNITHANLDPHTIFIDPAKHSACIIGGWWYATSYGTKFTALPSTTYNLVPSYMFKNNMATKHIDGECIKIVGRQLLGDIHGTKLLTNSKIPTPLLNWVRTPSSESAIAEYDTWMNKTLVSAFGARKFVEFNVSHTTVYQ